VGNYQVLHATTGKNTSKDSDGGVLFVKKTIYQDHYSAYPASSIFLNTCGKREFSGILSLPRH
jgi:hypothetical protein